jgi:hypothetical protein
MVNTSARLTALALSFSLFSATAKDVAEYRVGDTVAEDIVTPVPLMVVDPDATAALKEKEAQRIPVIFRFNRAADVAAEAELRSTFVTARSNFVFLMHDSFHHTRLTDGQLDTEQFRKLMASFKRRHAGFPLTVAIAREWARGNDVLLDQIRLIARVRQAMEQPVRHDNLTNTPKIGSQVLLVPVERDDEAVTLDDIKARGVNFSKTNLLTLSRARLALADQFSVDESEMARFATRALRINCFVESELTRAARARHTDPLFVADNYQAGQVIARRGQLVDQKIMAALTQLQEKTVAGRLVQQVAQEKVQAAQIRESNRTLIYSLIAAAVVLFVSVMWLALRRRTEVATLPVLAGAASVPAVVVAEERARLAEEKAARAHEALRSGVVAQLKDQMVSGLVTQRGEMLEAQQAAAAEMAELVRRLNELQSPLQERLKAYESRITDLERALAAKGAENRELIKAKIELTRKQLDAERGKTQVQFN